MKEIMHKKNGGKRVILPKFKKTALYTLTFRKRMHKIKSKGYYIRRKMTSKLR